MSMKFVPRFLLSNRSFIDYKYKQCFTFLIWNIGIDYNFLNQMSSVMTELHFIARAQKQRKSKYYTEFSQKETLKMLW